MSSTNRGYERHKTDYYVTPQNGSTDSIEYAHFVWQKGNNPKFTKLKVI